MRGKFSFLQVDFWFDVTKYKFIMKNSSFKMLVVFSPIFVDDTKITFVCNCSSFKVACRFRVAYLKE